MDKTRTSFGAAGGTFNKAGRVWGKVWRMIRWPFWILVALFIAGVIYRLPVVLKKQASDKIVTQIHADHITLDDVMGAHLPPVPDPALASSTIAGIDANNNGIRDDVELAIFKLHPDSARIRAAELQYAMELQNELTMVGDTTTMVAAAQETSRGYFCVNSALPKPPVGSSEDLWTKYDNATGVLTKEVEALVVNTVQRKKALDYNFQHITTHSDLQGPVCDLVISN